MEAIKDLHHEAGTWAMGRVQRNFNIRKQEEGRNYIESRRVQNSKGMKDVKRHLLIRGEVIIYCMIIIFMSWKVEALVLKC